MIPEPPRPDLFTEGQLTTRSAQEWLTLVWMSANAIQESGTTAQRPTTSLWIGRPYYDTTLNLPIWVNAVSPSVVWKDAAGNTV